MSKDRSKNMQNTFEKFEKLPAVLKIETAKNLSIRDLINLSRTSKLHVTLFKPLIDVPKFLHHVTRGEHDAVEAMLNKDMSLIFKRGLVTDCSGREFENVSGFEYALWALDKHMWAKMIVCIPRNEEGRKVFARLIAQYHKVNKDGVTYRFNGETIIEKHFDFENTIIKELQTQADSIRAPGPKDWKSIDKQWREGVGGAQKQLPMHVVDEYCSNDEFYPVPKFISQPKSSKQFYYLITDKDENWFSTDSKLAVDFAIFKASYGAMATPSCCQRPSAWRAYDLDAMKALCEVRTLDLINLESQLEEQASLDNDHQVVATASS